jgi:4-aminobutyrate aminotransferase-like enzyme
LRYLDFTSGVAVTSTGHAHPEVVRAIKEQAEKFLHMSGTDFYYPPQIELAEYLDRIAPMTDVVRAFFTNSGAESIEAAIKLALYATNRHYFIAFYGGFHGRTMGALAFTPANRCSASASFRRCRRWRTCLIPTPIARCFPTCTATRDWPSSATLRITCSPVNCVPPKSPVSWSSRSRARAGTSCRRRRSSPRCANCATGMASC